MVATLKIKYIVVKLLIGICSYPSFIFLSLCNLSQVLVINLLQILG